MTKTLAQPLAWRRDPCGAVLLSRTENPLVKVTPLTAEGRRDYDAIMRLIAAAPDLLACLIEMASGHSLAGEARARAAIAKATGDA